MLQHTLNQLIQAYAAANVSLFCAQVRVDLLHTVSSIASRNARHTDHIGVVTQPPKIAQLSVAVTWKGHITRLVKEGHTMHRPRVSARSTEELYHSQSAINTHTTPTGTTCALLRVQWADRGTGEPRLEGVVFGCLYMYLLLCIYVFTRVCL